MGGWDGGERQRDEAIFSSLLPVNGKVSGETHSSCQMSHLQPPCSFLSPPLFRTPSKECVSSLWTDSAATCSNMVTHCTVYNYIYIQWTSNLDTLRTEGSVLISEASCSLGQTVCQGVLISGHPD